MPYRWQTVDFRPVAIPGWRVVLLNEGQGWTSVPLAGWLIQAEIEESTFDGERPTGERRAVAAFMTDDYEPESTALRNDFWMVLGPGQDDPTAEQETEHRKYAARVAALVEQAPRAQ